MSQKARAVTLFIIVACFTVLIFGGAQIAKHKPPIPSRAVTASGEVVFTSEDVAAHKKEKQKRLQKKKKKIE